MLKKAEKENEELRQELRRIRENLLRQNHALEVLIEQLGKESRTVRR